ncbi:MAG: hypothetical protein WCJ29_00500 [bacterium]
MPNAKKILIGVIALFILVLILVALFLRGGGTKITNTPVTSAPQTSETKPEELVIPLAPVTKEQTAAQKNRNMSTFAMQFVERFGSFSSEANYQNIVDLYPVMTSSFAAEMKSFITNSIASKEFYGVTSRVLVPVKVTSNTGTSASVVVSAHRTEVKGTAPEKVYDQDIKMTLVKSGEEWLVDSAVWVK